ncbi:MAG: DUF167 domain-containing protein [Nanoarchaeota archaeon]|nr:DUF167 domain-containing protein [Nanoarchaeota archaeon]
MDISNYIKNNKLKIIVKTNSPKTEIAGYNETRKALKVNVNAVPENNKANIEILKFFKKMLKKQVKMFSGFKNREKVIEIFD